MNAITPEGLQKIQEISSRFGLNTNTTLNMLQAVVNGGGTMAQFNIPELGGGGQWMQGGMTMVGDMFNYSLKGTVNALCGELSNLIYNQNIFIEPTYQPGQFPSSGNWWPSEFGSPSSSGAQNNFKYAYFPDPVRRLAIQDNGKLYVYDTLNHHISGVSQQQGSNGSFSVSSQFGNVNIHSLPIVIDPDKSNYTPEPVQQAPFVPQPEFVPQPQVQQPSYQPIDTMVSSPVSAAAKAQEESVFSTIERLAGLKEKGYISEEEFQSKKTDLLNRL